jgi:hypothetical protein
MEFKGGILKYTLFLQKMFMKKQSFFKYIVAFFFAVSLNLAFGQGSNPGGGDDDFPCFPPPCIPIDGGITFLIAAGVGLAGKKLYDQSNNND